MSAMPHARQMEQVLANLATKSVAPSQKAAPPPLWRLVDRDGSTSSVAGPPPLPKKHECPDCLAGRCNQTAKGCQCSGEGKTVTISLDHLNDAQKLGNASVPTRAVANNATMPQAKPQLFEESSSHSSSTSFLEMANDGRKPFLTASAGVIGDPEPTSNALPSEGHKPPRESLAATAPRSDDQADELQRVIDRWPRLPLSARQAILILAGISNEADSA